MNKKALHESISIVLKKAYYKSEDHLGDYFKHHFQNNLIREINQALNINLPERDRNRLIYRVWRDTERIRKEHPDINTGEWLKSISDTVTDYLWNELF